MDSLDSFDTFDYIDCHADTLTKIAAAENLWENAGNLDLKRLRQFVHNYTQIFAVFADRAKISGSPQETFYGLYQRAVRLLQEQGQYLVWCKSAADMELAHAEGKAAAFLSVEDISLMGDLVKRIRELGIRFALLTWNYENEYACGAAAGQSKGLTQRGRALAASLLEQQIVLDISHLSDQGVEDLFLLTDRPVMASHSNVRNVCGHHRNLTKAHIRELIRRGGLMGLNFYREFVGEQPQMTDLLRHIDAVLELGGEDILAIGSDFDGCSNCFPDGITGVQSVPALRSLLEQEGFGSRIIEKLFYGNAHRFVMQNVR